MANIRSIQALQLCYIRTRVYQLPAKESRSLLQCGYTAYIKLACIRFTVFNYLYILRAGVIADFVPPPPPPPPPKSVPPDTIRCGFCPGGYNPLADSVRGDTIRQWILSGETCSASGFCPSFAECVPPPPSNN